MKRLLLSTGFLFVLTLFIQAQLTTPPSGSNQKSYVKQYIGAKAHVAIQYNSPDVTSPSGEDRTGKIWGQLVPYGLAANSFGTAKEIPWRSGSNENTKIYFSHDMLVQGQSIPAGKYGLHMIPSEDGPWTVIFSKNHSSWGSYYYSEAEDALRVEVTPKACEFTEWLTYEFIDRKETEATVALKWEKLSIPFKIELSNSTDIYISAMQDELRGATGFQWTNLNAAANYCLQNNTHLEQGLKWAEAASAPKSFTGQENFTTLGTKAGLLKALGQAEESQAVMAKAIEHPTANPFQIHGYARQLVALGQAEEAMRIFQFNYDKQKGAWPVNVGMARGLSAMGKYSEAAEYAQKALEQAPDKVNKDFLASAVEKLKTGLDIN